MSNIPFGWSNPSLVPAPPARTSKASFPFAMASIPASRHASRWGAGVEDQSATSVTGAKSELDTGPDEASMTRR